jgi:hypothetical protein
LNFEFKYIRILMSKTASNLRAKAVPQPVKQATTNHFNKLAQGEIAELKQSLRYAEHLLQ